MAHRIENAVERGAPIDIRVNGELVRAFDGETIATVLLISGVDDFHRSASNRPRAPFCNMGACFECLVQVDARGWVRACMTPVREGMSVVTGLCLEKSALPCGDPSHED